MSRATSCVNGAEKVGHWGGGIVYNRRELLAAICERFRAGECVPCRFFRMENQYLFIGEYKYWLMTDYNDIDPFDDEGDYVVNRARLYRDRRDFQVQPGDSGALEDYPASPARVW